MTWKDLIISIENGMFGQKYSDQDLANITGIKRENIYKLKKGLTKSPQTATINKLEKAFSIKLDISDPEKITYHKKERPKFESNFETVNEEVQIYTYPLLATVSAGHGDEELLLANEHVPLNYKPVNGHKYYAVKVNGNSMDSTITDGSIVLVDMEKELVNNCLVVVMLKNGKQFIKRYRDLNYEFIQLYPDNKEYESFVVSKKDIVDIRRVVGAFQFFD